MLHLLAVMRQMDQLTYGADLKLTNFLAHGLMEKFLLHDVLLIVPNLDNLR